MKGLLIALLVTTAIPAMACMPAPGSVQVDAKFDVDGDLNAQLTPAKTLLRVLATYGGPKLSPLTKITVNSKLADADISEIRVVRRYSPGMTPREITENVLIAKASTSLNEVVLERVLGAGAYTVTLVRSEATEDDGRRCMIPEGCGDSEVQKIEVNFLVKPSTARSMRGCGSAVVEQL